MADESKNHPPQDPPPEAEQEPEQGPEPQAEPDADAGQAQIAALTDRLIRLQADFENYRRRMQREKEEVAVFANQRLLLSLLPVLDNLERALAAPPNLGDEKLRQGVELTARSFLQILAKEGVTPIEAVGQPFDPNVHEAMMTEEDPEQEDGVVLAEFQKGYRLRDRVIRASMVKVNQRG